MSETSFNQQVDEPVVANDPTEMTDETLAEAVKRNPRAEISEAHRPFLEKVMLQAGLSDPYDARDITEVVFRVMRDVMTTEAADHVAEELHEPILETTDKTLQMEIVDLWHDTNPIVGFLSRVRPPWKGPGIFNIDDDRFLFRVANESGMSRSVEREQVVTAVFSATKDELSQERIQEISSWLPGKVKELWEAA
ncbi:DUF2267 domain-containing protein [Alkalinema pantanalense CENA528]|uniref:DUF2267 domain-containing protein n=1 Tax=Alkalinema pantanalense TaxID=1620705 RepID=UPI003D6F8BA0